MNVLVVVFRGQITREAVEEKLEPLTRQLRDAKDGQSSIIFDLLEFTGYDTDCRQQYIEWHRKHSRKLRRVAVLTNKLLLGSVVSAMGLAAGGHIRAFKSLADAESWCKQNEPRTSMG